MDKIILQLYHLQSYLKRVAFSKFQMNGFRSAVDSDNMISITIYHIQYGSVPVDI